MNKKAVLKGLEVITIGLVGALAVTAAAYKITDNMQMLAVSATTGVMSTIAFVAGLIIAD